MNIGKLFHKERVIVLTVGLSALWFINDTTDSPTLLMFVAALTALFFLLARDTSGSYHKKLDESQKMRGGGMFSSKATSHGSAEFAHTADLKRADRLRKDGYILGK